MDELHDSLTGQTPPNGFYHNGNGHPEKSSADQRANRDAWHAKKHIDEVFKGSLVFDVYDDDANFQHRLFVFPAKNEKSNSRAQRNLAANILEDKVGGTKTDFPGSKASISTLMYRGWDEANAVFDTIPEQEPMLSRIAAAEAKGRPNHEITALSTPPAFTAKGLADLLPALQKYCAAGADRVDILKNKILPKCMAKHILFPSLDGEEPVPGTLTRTPKIETRPSVHQL